LDVRIGEEKAMSLPENTSLPLLTRRQAVEFIRDEIGIPIAESTLNKKCALGQGPKVETFFGHRELYTKQTIREWRCLSPPTSRKRLALM
jgi:hypothetical protein